jgi:hypothetical protein
MGLIKEYELIFASGSRTGNEYIKNTRVVNINYHDFDNVFFAQKNDEKLILGDYCVFLDEGSVANEDTKIANYGLLEPKSFYGSLNNFFVCF